jgi:hydrogenase maturation protease
VSGLTLVAGIGNIFLGDDGFGVEVASRLAGADLPAGVKVVDYGIRGMHLAYDLAGGFDAAILVDAAPRGQAPGTVYVIEPDLSGPAGADPAGEGSAGAGSAAERPTGEGPAGGGPAATGAAGTGPATADTTLAATPLMDAHGMQPDVVLSMLDMLGGDRPRRILIVGCEPASVDYGIGLSEPVAAAVDEAVRVVLHLVTPRAADPNPGDPNPGGGPDQDPVAAAGAHDERLGGLSGNQIHEGWPHVPRHSR